MAALLCLCSQAPLTSLETSRSVGRGHLSGEAVSGNIGSQARQQYSISDNVVSLPHGSSSSTRSAVRSSSPSAEVLREAGENDHGAESLGLVQLKGRDEPIEIYRLA